MEFLASRGHARWAIHDGFVTALNLIVQASQVQLQTCANLVQTTHCIALRHAVAD